MANRDPDRPPPALPDRPARRRPARLWPLLFLPLLGLIAGIANAHRTAVILGFPNAGAYYVIDGAKGLAAGSLLMAVVALAVLIVRLAVRRYTLRSMLTWIALFALVLGAIRACGL